MLTSKQRAYLRGLGNPLDTILMVGKGGMSPEILKQADDAITAREIIKGKCLETSPLSSREAAEEIAVQLRLRNLSGIIIVDFIDMKEEESRKTLLAALRRAVTADPVKTVLVDMTPLGLVELTRKKIRRPLHEQVR